MFAKVCKQSIIPSSDELSINLKLSSHPTFNWWCWSKSCQKCHKLRVLLIASRKGIGLLDMGGINRKPIVLQLAVHSREHTDGASSESFSSEYCWKYSMISSIKEMPSPTVFILHWKSSYQSEEISTSNSSLKWTDDEIAITCTWYTEHGCVFCYGLKIVCTMPVINSF